jgi:hypothetical protein
LPANDDLSTSQVPLPFAIDFYGSTYSSLYVNNNGNLTMGQPFGQFTPQSLNQLGLPMIAPFWADVDTRVGPVVTYGYGTVNGHLAFGANWLDVGCYRLNNSVADTFQVLLISRPDVGYGDFDIEFNYGPLIWDSGQASGGDAQCLNGFAARAGYTSGFGASYELPGSGVDSALLSSNPITGLSSHGIGSSQSGRYVFAVRGSGLPREPGAAALGDSYSSGEGTADTYAFSQPCHRGALAWPFLMSAEYPAAPPLAESSFLACSGDTTTQMLKGSSNEPTPQLTQLTHLTASNGAPGQITLTAGGNDLGFPNIFAVCYGIGAPACVPYLDSKIAYLKSGAFTKILKDFYQAIRTATGSMSRVIVVGYPFLLPTPSFGHDLSADLHCPWLNGDAAQILSRFQEGQLVLDSVMAQAAAKVPGVTFIPLDDNPLGGHELCTGDSYFNDINPIGGLITHGSGHPTYTGQSLIAQYVAAQLGLLAGNGGAAAQRMARSHAKVTSERIKSRALIRYRARARQLRKSTAAAANPRARTAKGPRNLTRSPRRGRQPTSSATPAISSSLPAGHLSVPYSGFAWATGGTAPYTWSITAGSLPPGVSLDSSTGIISGTPTGSGTFGFTVNATDSSPAPQTTSASESITIAAIPALAIATSQLPDPTVGQQYAEAVSASGGLPGYTWAVTSGALPAGLTLDPATGVIAGTPAAAGAQTFSVSVTDSSAAGGTTATASFTMHVAASTSPLTLAAPQLPGGTQGRGYLGQLTSTGGAAPLLWSLISGSLPDGLSLDQGTGAISGIPTASGTFSFTAQAVDGSQPSPVAQSESLSITVAAAPAPAITTSLLPDGTAGSSYLGIVGASGGVAPYTWSVTSGVLPDGLTLDSQSGAITGIPTTAGTFSFDASLTDSATPNPGTASMSLSITIAAIPPPPAMTAGDTATDATVGDTYNASVIPDGGTGPYSFAVTSGSLPDGLSLDPQSGVISGTPTTPGSFTAAVQVTDSSSPTAETATDNVAITIQAPGPLTITTTTLPNAAVGAAYGQQVVASGGSGGNTFSVSSGTLPDGLTLDPATGIISGTPTGTGTSSFTVTVTDDASPTPDTASVDLALTTDPAPALTIPATVLPDAVQGVGYSQIMTAAGGTPPYSWSVSSGTLPDGLTLDPNAGIISGTPTGMGTSSLTMQVSDSASPTSQTATQALTLTVNPTSQLSVGTSSLDPATQGSPYSATLDSNGGTSPVTWSVTSGSLPDGLALDPNAGIISGTPTGYGTSHFTVQAVDSSSQVQTATARLALEVMPTPPSPQEISFTAPPAGAVGGSAILSATGGGSGNPVVFSVDSSSGSGVCAVSGSDGATLTYLAVGTCVIDADQNGNAAYSPAPQVQAVIPVVKASTATTVSLSKKLITYGHEKSLVITVKVRPQFTGTPTGTITVTAGHTTLCRKALTGAKATCSMRTAKELKVGRYKVRAKYSGSAAFLASSSAVVLLRVVAAAGSPTVRQPPSWQREALDVALSVFADEIRYAMRVMTAASSSSRMDSANADQLVTNI